MATRLLVIPSHFFTRSISAFLLIAGASLFQQSKSSAPNALGNRRMRLPKNPVMDFYGMLPSKSQHSFLRPVYPIVKRCGLPIAICSASRNLLSEYGQYLNLQRQPAV